MSHFPAKRRHFAIMEFIVVVAKPGGNALRYKSVLDWLCGARNQFGVYIYLTRLLTKQHVPERSAQDSCLIIDNPSTVC